MKIRECKTREALQLAVDEETDQQVRKAFTPIAADETQFRMWRVRAGAVTLETLANGMRTFRDQRRYAELMSVREMLADVLGDVVAAIEECRRAENAKLAAGVRAHVTAASRRAAE